MRHEAENSGLAWESESKLSIELSRRLRSILTVLHCCKASWRQRVAAGKFLFHQELFFRHHVQGGLITQKVWAGETEHFPGGHQIGAERAKNTLFMF